MKREDLEKMGFTKEQVDSVLDMHHKELDPVQKELNATKDALSTTEAALKKFDDVDPDSKKIIEDLRNELKQKDIDRENEIAEANFNELIKNSILAAKGKDADKIAKLLDITTLKESKNQKADVEAAVKALKEDEVTKGMFGAAEQPKPAGFTSPIGHIRQPAAPTNYLDEQYKGNPYYHPTTN